VDAPVPGAALGTVMLGKLAHRPIIEQEDFE